MQKRLIYLVLVSFVSVFCVSILAADVVNPDKPLKGTWDLKARKVWEITELEENPIISPILTVSDAEEVIVYERKLGKNYIIDKNGKLKTTFGPRGQGPGEIANEGLLFTAKNTPVVYDFPSRLHYFSDTGKFIEIKTINMNIIPYYFIDDYQYISAPPPGREKPHIKYVNLETGDKRVIKEIVYEGVTTEGGMIVAIPGFTGMLKLSVDPENKWIYYGIDDSYQINVLDFGGKIVNRFSVKRPKPKISNERKRKIIYDHFRGSRVENQSEGTVKYLSNELTYFDRIHVEGGWVLVFLNKTAVDWKNQPIDMFTPDGKYQYKSVFTPADGESISNNLSFGDVLFFKKGHLYVTLEDSEGEMKIAKYKISLPK